MKRRAEATPAGTAINDRSSGLNSGPTVLLASVAGVAPCGLTRQRLSFECGE